jgi:hypothetical protein
MLISRAIHFYVDEIHVCYCSHDVLGEVPSPLRVCWIFYLLELMPRGCGALGLRVHTSNNIGAFLLACKC